MTSQAWDQALASLAHGPPIVPGPPPKVTMTNAALWSRFFRRRVVQAREKLRGAEPVWINKRADLARARDAWRAHELAAKEAHRLAKGKGEWRGDDWHRHGDVWKWTGRDRRFAKHY